MSATTVAPKDSYRMGSLATSLITMVIAAAVAVLLYGIIENAPAEIATRPYWDMWAMMGVVAFVGWLVVAFALPIATDSKFRLAVVGLSLFMVGMIALALKDTPYPFDAVEADQRFYAAFVTKLATQWGYGDVVYEHLPAFYPPLYFWILGRVAAIANLEPYTTLKIGVLLTAFLMPYAVTWLWARSVTLPLAVAAAFGMLLYQEWFKTAEWVSLVLFIPWWLYWVENVTERTFATRRDQWLWWGVGGIIGSIIFQTYYYWFFLGGISLLIQMVWGRLYPKESRAFPLRNAITMLAATALFSVVYWGPYLVSMATTSGWQPLQNRWLSEGKIPLPFSFFDDSIEGVLLLGGLIYLAVTAPFERLSRGMLALVAAVYVWSGLGIIGMLTERPLLTFRAYTLVDALLSVAVVMAAVRLWQGGVQSLKRPTPFAVAGWSQSAIGAAARRVMPVLAIALILFFSQETALGFIEDEMVATARNGEYPQQMVESLDTLTGGGYQDKTFLLGYGYRDLFSYRPLYAFIPWSAHFSHPSGLYRERIDFLESLAATTDPALFAAALMNNRYEPIDHLLLERENNAWRLTFLDDNFPNRTLERAFLFDESLFVPPYFQSQELNGLTLITPNPDANPLNTLDPTALESAPLESVALYYNVVTTFGTHIGVGEVEAGRVVAAQRLETADLSTLSTETLLGLHNAAEGTLYENARRALVAKLPYTLDVPLVDRDGVERVRVIGYALAPRGDGSHNLDLYFESIAPLDREYTLWVHATRDDAQSNFDHALSVPPTTWEVGNIYRDRYTITVESGDYHVNFGLWQSEGEIRLRRPDGGIDVDLGTLTVE
jgi:galactan 5-O-arabinofuranosyltransferase